jgi:hypothetical protein
MHSRQKPAIADRPAIAAKPCRFASPARPAADIVTKDGFRRLGHGFKLGRDGNPA